MRRRPSGNRRARFYRLTPKGRRQLATEPNRRRQLAEAIARVMAAAS